MTFRQSATMCERNERGRSVTFNICVLYTCNLPGATIPC